MLVTLVDAKKFHEATLKEWKDEVEILVNPEDEYYSSFFLNKWNREMVEKLYPRRSALTEMKKMIQALFYILRNKFKSRFSNHRSHCPNI